MAAFFYVLKAIRQSDRAPLLQLEIAHILVARIAVVESWIEEQVGRDILRHLQLKLVFPLHLSLMVGSIGIKARLPRQLVEDVPLEFTRKLRSKVFKGVVVALDTIGSNQRLTSHIAEVEGRRAGS